MSMLDSTIAVLGEKDVSSRLEADNLTLWTGRRVQNILLDLLEIWSYCVHHLHGWVSRNRRQKSLGMMADDRIDD